MSEITELEGAVVGLLALKPKSTAYEVRREFQKSGTAHWQASAGAIYPLLKRLARKGLLSATVIEGDGRGTKRLELTAAGMAEAHAWIFSEKAGLATATPDPIRTRCHFLALVTGGERVRLITQWISQTVREIEGLLSSEPFDDIYEQLAVEGAIAQLTARQEWLERISERLP